MGPDADTGQTQLADVLQRLAAVERRLTALEGGTASAGLESEATVPEFGVEVEAEVEDTPTRSVSELLPIVGRTVLIVGGAFVLRAVTEAGWLGLGAGAAAGIVYAAAWIVVAHRTAVAGRQLEATLYGLAATVIAFPLIWETTISFKLFSVPASAAAIVIFTAFALLVCWRDRLRGLAWIVTLAGGMTTLGLAVATRELPVLLVALLLIGLATLWIGWAREWSGLAGTIAVPANVGVLLMTLIVLRVEGETVAALFDPSTVVVVQIALVVIYVGSLVVRTLASHRELDSSDITLGVMATIVGLGGAMVVVRTTGVATAALGALALAMAIGSYAAAFTLIDRRQTGRVNFVFYSTLALACTLVGFETLLRGVPLTVALALVAVVAAWAGSHWDRSTLSGHGAIYAAVAGFASGMFAFAMAAFVSNEPAALSSLGWAAWIALPVILGCTLFRVATHGRTWGRLSGFPKLTFITVALFGLGGVAISAIAPLVLGGTDAGRDAAALAVVRTGTLAVSAVILAWLGGHERFREASWLVYPVLIAAAVKLLAEDFRAGRPATLVLSLALFGGALILAPRIASHAARKRETRPA